MGLTRLLIAFTLISLSSTLIFAQSSSTVPTTEPLSIETLFQQLGHESWQVRQRAQSELVSHGSAVRQRLESLVQETQDEEVRTRATAAIRQIDDDRLFGTSYITLDLKDVYPEPAFAELARQAYADLPASPNNLFDQRSWPPLKLNIQRQPFWLVAKDLCTRTSLGIGCVEDRVVITAGGSDRFSSPSVIEGAFLITAVSIIDTRVIQFARPDNRQQNLILQLNVIAEPKLRIVGHSTWPQIERAEDETGQSLLSSMSSPGTIRQFSPEWSVPINLTRPQKSGQRIAILKGTMNAIVQTRSQIVEIPDIMAAHNVAREIEGYRLVVTDLQHIGPQYQLRLKVSVPQSAPPSQPTSPAFHPTSLRLLDRTGHPLRRSGFSSNTISPNQMEWILQYHPARPDPNSEPAKLVCEIPLETRVIPIPFEFRDLPLP